MGDKPRSRSRFLATNLLVLLALLAAAELLLRLSAPRPLPPATMPPVLDVFLPVERDGETWMSTDFNSQYETDGVPLDAELSPQEKQAITRRVRPLLEFPREKPPGQARVFVLGSSPIWGHIGATKDDHTLLALYLRERLDPARCEIINAAHIGFGAPQVLGTADEALRHGVDLAVVYFGGVMPLLAPEVDREQLEQPPEALRRHRLLSRSELVRTFFRWRESKQEPEVDPQLVPAFSPGSKPLSEPTRYDERAVNVIKNLQAETEHDYRRMFTQLARRFTEQKRKLLFCTVATNTADIRPFWSLHLEPIGPAEREQFAALYRQGQEAVAAGDYDRAAVWLEQAINLGPTFADAHFGLGRVYRALGEHDKARAAFRRAKEYDASNERALDRPNEILREVAAAYGVPVLDVETLLRELPASNGYLGDELFLDHQHMNPLAVQALADALAQRIPTVISE